MGLMRLAYVVHDLSDPAVARRLDMLRPHLEDALVIGFHRGETAPREVAGWPTHPLGRTQDGRMLQRMIALVRARAGLGNLASAFAGRNVIMSRLLEALVLASAARKAFAPQAVLAHECLDIHRLMVSEGLVGRALRQVEARLLRDCDLMVVSSPAFVSEYLIPRHGDALPPVQLVENKVLADEVDGSLMAVRPVPGPPWRIGWYGMIRCRQSLTMLAAVTRRLQGRVEVEIRGRPALAAIPDFHRIVDETPGLSFHGAYDRRRDLGAMYGAVHFTWAIDYYEAGANSDWLLPNRLYEGSLHGAVPIALHRVETGRWLARHGAGLLLGDAAEDDLAAALQAMTAECYSAATAAVSAIARIALVEDGSGAQHLAEALQRRRLKRTGFG